MSNASDEFLKQILKNGNVLTSLVVKSAEKLGITKEMLRKSRYKLGIKTYSTGKGSIGGVWWHKKNPDLYLKEETEILPYRRFRILSIKYAAIKSRCAKNKSDQDQDKIFFTAEEFVNKFFYEVKEDSIVRKVDPHLSYTIDNVFLSSHGVSGLRELCSDTPIGNVDLPKYCYYDEVEKKYKVHFTYKKDRINLGSYASKEEASKVALEISNNFFK